MFLGWALCFIGFLKFKEILFNLSSLCSSKYFPLFLLKYLYNLSVIPGSGWLSFSQSAVLAVTDPPGFCELSYFCMQVFPLIATWNLSSFD